jgi:hypothetical protein
MAGPFQGLQRRIGLSGALLLGEPGPSIRWMQLGERPLALRCKRPRRSPEALARGVAPLGKGTPLPARWLDEDAAHCLRVPHWEPMEAVKGAGCAWLRLIAARNMRAECTG